MQQLGAHDGMHDGGGIAGMAGAQHPIGAQAG